MRDTEPGVEDIMMMKAQSWSLKHIQFRLRARQYRMSPTFPLF